MVFFTSFSFSHAHHMLSLSSCLTERTSAKLVGSSESSTTHMSAYKTDVTNSLYTWGIPCLGMLKVLGAELWSYWGYKEYLRREGVPWQVDTWDCEWILLVSLRHSVFRVKWWIRIYSNHLSRRTLVNHQPNLIGVNLMRRRSQRWWLTWRGRGATTKERFWER